MKTTRKHFIGAVALIIMLCTVFTMFASCSLFKAKISLDKTEASLYVGDSIKLEATVSKKEAEVEWSTSDEKVATVRRGTVSAVGVGTAVITASLEGGASATCTINVSERTVTISQTTATINLDESNTLTLTASASDGGEITWTSSDPAIATVAGGVVTAYDIGTVTITAQRGAAIATCEISVIEPSRPEDYYHITKLTNAEVVADPGVWHYHADGSMGGDYGFSSNPLHRDATASATLNVIPKVANSQYFYFRYQPDQVELNSYYVISVTITVSEDATLRIGSRRIDGSTFAPLTEDFKAGEPKTVEYIGYKNEYEPFSVRINSEINAESVTLSVKLNSVVAHDGTNLPEYHTSIPEKPNINYEQLPTDESAYDLEPKTNGETMSSPDKWHFNQGESSIVSSAKYNNGTITFDFETLQTTGNSQLRLRPTLDPNTKIKVEFTVTSNVPSKVVLALCDSVTFASTDWNEKRLDGTNSQTFAAEMTIKESQLIFIQVQALDETKSNASFTFSDIKIYVGTEVEAPVKPELPTIENGYYLTHSNNAGVVADPGKWFYFGDNDEGVDYVLASAPKIENGVITYAFSSMTADANYQLRYQPTFAVGTKYTATVTVTVDGACRILYSNEYKVHVFEEAGSAILTWSGLVSDSAPYMIQIKECTAPITITVSDISFTEGEPENPDPDPGQGGDEPQLPPIENGYYLESGNKDTVRANLGTWFYWADDVDGVDYEFASAPKIENGVITFAFNRMAELNLQGNQPAYQLRYQPDLAVGTIYSVTFTVEVSAAGKVVYGSDYKACEFAEAGSQTITWEGAVSASEVFLIQVRSTDRTAPITMTISNISIEEHEHNYNQESDKVAVSSTSCSTNQFNYYKCACGAVGEETYEVENTALDHKYTDYSSNNDATCVADGTKTASCDYGCGTPDTIADEGSKLDHKYTDYSSNNDATCVADGTKTAYCDYDCGTPDTVADEGSAGHGELVSIAITTQPTKNAYKEGDLFDASGMVVTATCDKEGCPGYEVTEYTVDKTDALTTDDTIVTISYEGKTATVEIAIEEVHVHAYNQESNSVAIEATCTANQFNYYKCSCGLVDETNTYEVEDSALGHKYTDYIPNGDATCVADGTKTAACDNGCDTPNTITDEGSAGHGELVSISISTHPTKTEYKAGESFDATGMVVTATCGKEGCPGYEVTEYSVDKADALTVEDTIVTVSYEGKTATVAITVSEAKPTVSYELTSSNNAGVIANPGKWFYSFDGADGNEYDIVSAPKYEDGTIVVEFIRQATGSPTYQLRYQPDLEVGTEYTFTFTVTVSAAGRLGYGPDNKAEDIAAGETKTITWTGAVGSSPFYIQVRATDRSAPITITVSNILINGESVDNPNPTPDPEEPKVSYELTSSNNSGVVSNPGKWFYSFDGTDGNEYDIVAIPKYEDGTIVVEFNRMAEGSPTYQLRYQPELEVGTNYTITFTVEVSAAGKIVYGNDYQAHEFTEAGSKTLTWTGAVDGTNKPFMIQIRSTERSAPITLTVSDITIVAN